MSFTSFSKCRARMFEDALVDALVYVLGSVVRGAKLAEAT